MINWKDGNGNELCGQCDHLDLEAEPVDFIKYPCIATGALRKRTDVRCSTWYIKYGRNNK